jgi:hypothetical protein
LVLELGLSKRRNRIACYPPPQRCFIAHRKVLDAATAPPVGAFVTGRGTVQMCLVSDYLRGVAKPRQQSPDFQLSRPHRTDLLTQVHIYDSHSFRGLL